jgi:hypothetical protein
MSTFTESTTAPTARTRLYAVAGAVLAVAAVWAAARIAGADLRVDPGNGQPPGTIALPFAAGVTLVVAALGWGPRAGLDRMTRRAHVVWTVLAGTVLAVSFLPLLGVEATGGTKAALALMHVSVAAVLLPVLGRRTG